MEKIEYAWGHPLHPQKKETVAKKPVEHREHSHKTLGQKISHILFDFPTDRDLGIPAPKEHLSKAEAIKKIEEAWDHPFGGHDKPVKEHKESEHHAHKTLGQKVSHLLLDVPTDSDLGLPAPKEHFSKEEAIKRIEEAWDHPFGGSH